MNSSSTGEVELFLILFFVLSIRHWISSWKVFLQSHECIYEHTHIFFILMPVLLKFTNETVINSESRFIQSLIMLFRSALYFYSYSPAFYVISTSLLIILFLSSHLSCRAMIRDVEPVFFYIVRFWFLKVSQKILVDIDSPFNFVSNHFHPFYLHRNHMQDSLIKEFRCEICLNYVSSLFLFVSCF